MTVKDIVASTGLKEEIAETLYWKCMWLREVPPTHSVMWPLLFKSKKYRITGKEENK